MVLSVKNGMVDMIIGFLTPNGTFIKCNSWEHFDTALRICRKIGENFYNGYEAEQYLLNKGCVIFRSRDAYMNHYKDAGKGFDKDNVKIIYLTEAQLKWINQKQDKAAWNNIEQAECVNEILKWDADLRDFE